MEDADEKRSNLGTLSLWAAAGMFVVAACLTGPLAVACGIIGGIALATGLAATVFAPVLGDGGEWQASRPPEDEIGTAAEPQQAVRLHVDAPQSVRRWLERVERSAKAEAAERRR